MKADEEVQMFRRLAANEPKLREWLNSQMDVQLKVLKVNTDHSTILQTQGRAQTYQLLMDRLDVGSRS